MEKDHICPSHTWGHTPRLKLPPGPCGQAQQSRQQTHPQPSVGSARSSIGGWAAPAHSAAPQPSVAASSSLCSCSSIHSTARVPLAAPAIVCGSAASTAATARTRTQQRRRSTGGCCLASFVLACVTSGSPAAQAGSPGCQCQQPAHQRSSGSGSSRRRQHGDSGGRRQDKPARRGGERECAPALQVGGGEPRACSCTADVSLLGQRDWCHFAHARLQLAGRCCWWCHAAPHTHVLPPPLPRPPLPFTLVVPHRPPSAQEIAERAVQAIQCNDALREVTLYQSVGGKQMSRTFRYDRVRVRVRCVWRVRAGAWGWGAHARAALCCA